jgi:demethylmenaquinone methyltransferase/2-methoxy-6-polyprenyl-1,4-benzoquinol methylase
MVTVLTEINPVPGARPAGTSSRTEAAQSIQQMFDTIAPTYDRANHLLSAGIDRSWWNRAASTLRPILARPEAVILDLCCGTGDLTLALDKHRPQPISTSPEGPGAPSMTASSSWVGRMPTTNPEGPGAPSMTASSSWMRGKPSASLAPILALDFSHNMLSLALPKFLNKNILPIEADALHLPIADNSIDLVTSAFGFRNLTSYPAGLAELYRILRPGGQIAILECNQPGGLIGWLYSFYFHHILPTLGGFISGKRRAYAYLPDSVMKFPRPPQMKVLIAAAGFADPTWTSYTLGTVGLYRATKP